MAGRLGREIQQKRPFRSVQEEFVLGLVRTAQQLSLPFEEVLRESRLSSSQYNVLRILRGAGDEGLPCGEISQRMVQRDPDLTRLLDRLEQRGLVARSRGTEDRRVVRASITKEGLRLLAELDDPVEERLKKSLRHVSQQDLRTLVELLDRVRNPEG
ncbi:MAG TPA: MarR family transcriptional regulator [Thermoanaerobaculia bacterium]